MVFTLTFRKRPKSRSLLETKITRASCRRCAGRVVPIAEGLVTWLQRITKFPLKKVNRGTIIDMPWWYKIFATQWIQSYPCKTKTHQETQKSRMKFLEPMRQPKVIYTDNYLEFGKSCEELSWNHCTSTPHRSETNGIAQRAVRREKEGTSAVLSQSGLDNDWWADSIECYCNHRNIQDLFSVGKTPFERRFGKPFKGPVIPFGAMVSNITQFLQKGSVATAQVGLKKNSRLCIIRGEIWKGDITVADIEELEEMDASELHARRLKGSMQRKC